MTFILAIDTGGTFTDLVVYDTERRSLAFSKSLTTYDSSAGGLLQSIDRLAVDLAEVDIVKVGTTLVINTLIQRSGARTALVTTQGFRDVLELRRGNRPVPFDLRYRRDPLLIERNFRLEIDERMNADCTVLKPVDPQEVEQIALALRELKAEAVAISFINAYANPAHETAVAEQLRQLLSGVYVSAGTEVSAEWYEYERTSTAAANAYVGPIFTRFLSAIQKALGDRGFTRNIFLMGSHGGLCSVERARRQPVTLVESGPAGGCIGTAAYATELGIERAIAFDMGGTTAKCALVEGGHFRIQNPYYVGGVKQGFPIRGNVVDIVEVGAGGGSIASVDAQGRLSVGPRSAGSSPGPVAYGRGGTEPTITDANILLGRIDPGTFLAGEITLDVTAANDAISRGIARPLGLSGDASVYEAAQGIVTLSSIIMAGAIKRITIEQGLDPRDFALIVFGGGGPLHGVELARELSIGEVIVPPAPGVFSALGMLLADARIDDLQPFLQPLDANAIGKMDSTFETMSQSIAKQLKQETGTDAIVYERQAEMRYRGQKHAIRVLLGTERSEEGIRDLFITAHRHRYGHAESAAPVELVSLVLSGSAALAKPSLEQFRPPRSQGGVVSRTRRMWSAAAKDFRDVPVYERAALPLNITIDGPAIVEEYGSATIIEAGDRLTVGDKGELRIRVRTSP
jgi:N-methylhydantoinase A